MNQYYINGAEVIEATARDAFYEYYGYVGTRLSADIAQSWAACQISEEARDNLLPSHVEIVQGEWLCTRRGRGSLQNGVTLITR